MEPKIINAREIEIKLIYNTKKIYYHFKVNKGKEKLFNWKLAQRNFCTALNNENAIFMRMLLRGTYDLMNKKDKRYFNKLKKQTNNV